MTRRAPRLVLFAFAAFAASASSASTAYAQQPDTAIRRPAQRTPPAAAASVPLLTPPDSAVALCVDGTWIKEPGVAGDCASRGGLKVAMPLRQKPPVVNRTAPLLMRTVSDEQAPPPANATGRCKDGTFLTTPVADNSCADRGGLAVRFPQRQLPPPRPRP